MASLDPVWTVYDALRTVRLNKKYYCCRLDWYEKLSTMLDVILALTAPSSAIAGLWFWETASGKIAWRYLGVIAAVVAVVKPLFRLTKRIGALEGLVAGYRLLDFEYMQLKASIEQKGTFDAALQGQYRQLSDREKEFVVRNPESRENVRVKKKCEREVLLELPTNQFFLPQG
jgi:hypothetical protein